MMKKLYTVLLLTMITLGLQAQEIGDLKAGEKPAQAADKWVSIVDRKVDLSEEQALDMKDILLAGYEEMQSIRDKYKVDLQKMKQEVTALKDKHGEVNGSNREHVRKDLQIIRQKFKPQMDEMRQEIRAIKDVAKIEIRSVLTTDQLGKLRSVNENRKQQYRKRLQDKKRKRPIRKK